MRVFVLAVLLGFAACVVAAPNSADPGVRYHNRVSHLHKALQDLAHADEDNTEILLAAVDSAFQRDAGIDVKLSALDTLPANATTGLSNTTARASNSTSVDKGTVIYENNSANSTNAAIQNTTVAELAKRARRQARKEIKEKLAAHRRAKLARKFGKQLDNTLTEIEQALSEKWRKVTTAPTDNAPAARPFNKSDAKLPTQDPKDTSTWIYNKSINVVPSAGPYPGKNDYVHDNATGKSPRWHMWPSDETDNLDEVLEKLPVHGNWSQERNARILTMKTRNDTKEQQEAQLLVPSQFATDNRPGWPSPIVMTPYGTVIVPYDAMRKDLEDVNIPQPVTKPNVANFIAYFPLADLKAQKAAQAGPGPQYSTAQPLELQSGATPTDSAPTSQPPSAPVIEIPATPLVAVPTPASATAAAPAPSAPTMFPGSSPVGRIPTAAPVGTPVAAPSGPLRTRSVVPMYDVAPAGSSSSSNPEVKAHHQSSKYTKVEYVPKGAFDAPSASCGDECAAMKAAKAAAVKGPDAATAALAAKAPSTHWIKPKDFFEPRVDPNAGLKRNSESTTVFSATPRPSSSSSGSSGSAPGFSNGFQSGSAVDPCTVAVLRTADCDKGARVVPVVMDYDYKKF